MHSPPLSTLAPPQTMREKALQLASQGWPVFPLQANGKIPLGGNGHLDATTDLDRVRASWTDVLTGSPLDYNIGIRPLAGKFCVVDLDEKDQRDGTKNYEALGGAIGGRVVRTPSGGLHVYLAGADIATTAGRLAPGVDSRGADGYVVAPGSVIDGVAYELIENGPMLPVPRFVLDVLPARSERDSRRMITRYMIESDAPNNLARAAEIAQRAEPAVSGCWHDYGFKLGAEMARVGLSPEMAVATLAEHWVPRGEGFKSYERFEADVLGGYHDAERKGEHGAHSCDRQIAAFRGISVAAPPDEPDRSQNVPAVRTSRIRAWTPDECLAATPAPYLIKGLLARGQIGLIIGPPGSGKSCLTPLMAYKLAQGLPVFGMRTQPGRVLYLALEDESGMRNRIGAHRLHYGDAPDFRVITGVSSMFDPGNSAAIKDMVTENDPALVIFDTLRAGWRGLKENDADSMGEVVKTIRHIIGRDDGQPGPAALVPHHPTKSNIAVAAGSGVLDADVDVSLYLERDRDTNTVSVSLGKNRNGESYGRPMAFTILPVQTRLDAEGDPVTAPVAVEVEAIAGPREKRLTGQAETALFRLRELIEAGGPDIHVQPAGQSMVIGGIDFAGSSGVLVVEWGLACEARGLSRGADSTAHHKAFKRAKAALLERGLIVETGDRVYLLAGRE